MFFAVFDRNFKNNNAISLADKETEGGGACYKETRGVCNVKPLKKIVDKCEIITLTR